MPIMKLPAFRLKHRRVAALIGAGLLVLLVAVTGGFLVFLARQQPAKSSPLQVLADVPLSGGASRFDYQSLDPTAHRLFVAHLGAGIITVINTESDQVVADIPGIAGVHGVLVVPELGRVYASATAAHQIAVLDERTLQVIARIPGGNYPDGLAYVPTRQEIFVSDEAGGAEIVIDVRSNRQVATIPLGGEAGNTQYDPISGHIFVDVQTHNQLAVINTMTNAIIGRYSLSGCDHDHGLLLDAPQRLAFVACDGDAKLLMMDIESMRMLAADSVGSGPDVLALDRGTHLLYVACESGVVSVLDEHGRAMRKVGEGYVARAAHSIAVDEATHRLFLPLESVDGRPVLRIARFQRGASGGGDALGAIGGDLVDEKVRGGA